MRPERLDGVLPGAMRQHAPLFFCQNNPTADDRINRFFLVKRRGPWHMTAEPFLGRRKEERRYYSKKAGDN